MTAIPVLRAKISCWKGSNGGCEVKVFRNGFMSFEESGGKYGREIVYTSKVKRDKVDRYRH